MRSLASTLIGLVSLLAACSGESHTAADAAAGDGGLGAGRDGGPAADGSASPDGAPVLDGGHVDVDGGPVRPRPELWFEDVTSSAGVTLDRVARESYGTLPDRMSGGVCVIDADGRGTPDLFFALRPVDGGPASTLYVADEPLSYTDETATRGLSDVGDAMGCLVFDEDGDGDDDLWVTRVGSVALFRNDGGVFVETTGVIEAPFDERDMYMGASAGDVDGDGDLDVAVSGFVRFDRARHAEGATCGLVPCNASITAFEYAPNLLLVREDDGVYRARAETLAPDMARREPALLTAVRDLDGDHAPEIYVGNDLGYTFVDRVLRRTSTGSFVDVAEALGMAWDWRGYGIDTMGFASADLDGDGRLDHVVTSFETDATAVFVWEGDHYVDRARTAGTIALDDTFRWGAALVDLDLDGDPDLVEATGHFHSDEEVELHGYLAGMEQRPNLMVNLGDGTFRAVAPSTEDGMHEERAARGIAVTDLDSDGRPDVVLAPAVGRPALLRNVRPPAGHWLHVRLEGRPPNTGAVGARVIVSSSERTVVRERVAGEGYLGSFDPRLLFGVPTGDPVDVEVRWPDGDTTTLRRVGVDDELRVTEP